MLASVRRLLPSCIRPAFRQAPTTPVPCPRSAPAFLMTLRGLKPPSLTAPSLLSVSFFMGRGSGIWPGTLSLTFAWPLEPEASFAAEDKGELLRLCRIWDFGAPFSRPRAASRQGPHSRFRRVQIPTRKQRQIGDRRGQNSWEARLCGPSRFLPTGALLARLHVPKGFCLSGCVTDRRDFYTQARVSFERSRTNAVGPCFQLSDFRSLSAHLDFCTKAAENQVWALSSCEGVLDFPPRPSVLSVLVSDSLPVHPTFKALLQGDAGGVEFATAAHLGMLQSAGCLLGPRAPGAVSSLMISLASLWRLRISFPAAPLPLLDFSTVPRLPTLVKLCWAPMRKTF